MEPIPSVITAAIKPNLGVEQARPGLSLVILSKAKDLCTFLAAEKMHRSFAAKNAAQDDNRAAHGWN
jgi:hypothetical protein